MNVRMGVLTIDSVDDDEEVVEFPAMELVLSERNLRTLLANLDQEDYSVSRLTDAGVFLSIRGEKNEVHYADRAAGLMDEATEAKLMAEEFADSEQLFIPPDFGNKLND